MKTAERADVGVGERDRAVADRVELVERLVAERAAEVMDDLDRAARLLGELFGEEDVALGVDRGRVVLVGEIPGLGRGRACGGQRGDRAAGAPDQPTS